MSDAIRDFLKLESTSGAILFGAAMLCAIMWVAMLKSGVHATLAGVMLAFFIPIRDSEKEASPLHELEHDLHTAVAFAILPIFAFANAGISLTGVSPDYLLHPVPLGIAMGLFFGKQIGVFAFCWLAVKAGWTRLPDQINWIHVYGCAFLCGIGFTMSLLSVRWHSRPPVSTCCSMSDWELSWVRWRLPQGAI